MEIEIGDIIECTHHLTKMTYKGQVINIVELAGTVAGYYIILANGYEIYCLKDLHFIQKCLF